MIRLVNCAVTGPLWCLEKVVAYLVCDQSVSNTRGLSQVVGCERQLHPAVFITLTSYARWRLQSGDQPNDCLLNHYWGADHRKDQSSASLAFVRRFHRWAMNFLHKGTVTRKMLPVDDVIMLYEYFDLSIAKAQANVSKAERGQRLGINAGTRPSKCFIFL